MAEELQEAEKVTNNQGEMQAIPGTDLMQLEEVTAAKSPDWIYHATDARLALLITMHNEWECVVHTLKRVRERFAWIGIVRSYTPVDPPSIGLEVGIQPPVELSPFAFLEENDLKVEFTQALPDLAGQYSKWELPAQSICRNYSALFSAASLVPDIDCCVAITGDTVLLHSYGVEEIVAAMEQKGAILGCSKACGQDFHRADLTLEELEAGKGGGRRQGLDVPDFQPQFFAVKHEAVQQGAYSDVEVVNVLCSEACLGEMFRRMEPKKWKKLTQVFSETAFGWLDGFVYHAVTHQPGGEE